MTDEEQPLEYFTEAELDAIARMLVIMLRADGQASEAEQEALLLFADRVRLGERVVDTSKHVDVLKPFIDRAAALPATREDFVRAAQTITNDETRQAVYAALFDISASDVIVQQEWDLLKVLVDTWGLEIT